MRASVGQQRPQSVASDQPEDSRLEIRTILNVLRRHKWLIAGTVIGLMAATLLITLQLKQQYTATTLVVVDSRGSQMLGFAPGIAEGVNANSQIDTEVEIARSSKVGERAAMTLGIAQWPEFAPRVGWLSMLRSMVGLGSAEPADAPLSGDFADYPPEAKARLAAALIDRTSIRRIGLTSVISISATDPSPLRSAEIANAMADAYLTEQIAAKINSNERTAAFLNTRVASLATDIDTIEGQIDTFVSKTIAELGTPAARELLTRISEESKQRTATQGTLAELEEAIRAGDVDRIAVLAGAGQIDLAARRKALVAEMTDVEDPLRVAQAKAQLDSLDAEIKTAAERRTEALQADLSASQTRTSEARKLIEGTVNDLQLPQEVSTELFRLQRDAETRRSLYESFLTKLRGVEQQTDFTVPDSRVIATATPPTSPSFPPSRLILAGAFLFSLGAGLGLAFLRETFIGGVTSVEQLENLSGLPVVAAVPRHSGGQMPDRPDLAIVSEPLSAFSESIRRIRLGIETYGPKGKKAIFVTSPLPADGKTTIAMTLARHMAMTGSSTLLIDADLRHPSVHRLLQEDVKSGLIDFLALGPEAEAERLTMVTEPATGVNFMLGAEASAVATDALLMSPRFDELMDFVRERYDVVIVDTPPVGLVVDATIVARHCDIGVFVVRYASTGQRAIGAALRDLSRRVDLPVCGVLNQVEKADSYQYGYDRKYHGYYR